MKLLLTLLCFLSTVSVIAQISGIDPSSIRSEEDLKQLGVTEAQIQGIKSDLGLNEADSEVNREEQINPEIVQDVPVQVSPVNTPKPSSKTSDAYGAHLLTDGSIGLQTNKDVLKPSENYVLNSGDIINISIWGNSDFAKELQVDQEGYIYHRHIGKLNVKGKTYDRVKDLLTSRLSRVFDLTSSQLSIDLTYSKVIRVYIGGEVVSPGAYNVASINTMLNVLTLSNGISPSGSVRNIWLIRDGKKIKKLDLYSYLGGESFESPYLLEGDLIFVDIKENLVQLSGGVKRPSIYELTEKEGFSELIEFAGGLDKNSIKDYLKITYFENGETKYKEYLDYSQLFSAELDTLNYSSIKSIEIPVASELLRNYYSVTGEVINPGNYPLTDSLTLAGVLSKVKGLTPNAFNESGYIVRKDATGKGRVITFDLDNAKQLEGVFIKEFDEVVIKSNDDLIRKEQVSIFGQVQAPGSYDYYDGLTLRDLVLMSNGFTLLADSNTLELVSIQGDGTKSSRYITYSAAINLELSPDDILIVRLNSAKKQFGVVEVSGEVNNPGEYVLIKQGERFSEVLERSGGVTDWANLESIYIERKNNDENGLLLVDVSKALKSPKSTENYYLQDGDVIRVPRFDYTVELSGAIGYKSVKSGTLNVPYKSKSAFSLIRTYGGGFEDNAKKRKTYVIDENGQIRHKRFLKPLKVHPGSSVYVPVKEPKKERTKGEKIDWNKQIEQLMVKVTAVASLAVLLNSLTN